MVRPFEDAVFSLDAGQIFPLPVRTQFGYHVIKVYEKEPNRGIIQIAHVLKRFAPGKADSASVRKMVRDAYDRISSGAITFEQAVEQYSDDGSSKQRQGLIGQYERGRLPPDLASFLFSTPVGSVTAPYEAEYGIHIFKVLSASPLPSFSAMQQDLRQYYQQFFYVQEYENFLHRLKERYKLQFDVPLRYNFSHSFDSTLTPSTGDWTAGVKAEWLPARLFTYADRSVTIERTLKLLQKSEEFAQQHLTPRAIDEIIDRIVDAEILGYHAETIEQRHPLFASLMQEYEHGVLIFRMDQDEIWSKVAVTDSALRDFYGRTKEQYRWGRRINVAEIFVHSDSAAQALYTRAMAGEDFKALAAQYTLRPGFREKQGEWGLLPFNANLLTDHAVAMRVDSVSQPFAFENGWSIIKVLERVNHTTKTFEEALPEVRSKYQEQAAKERERQWIESLKERYNVNVNPDAVSEAFKNPHGS
jgi:peptidyl-prolyl cis-trans isomerase SurA